MAEMIMDGLGNGYTAKVGSDNRLFVDSTDSVIPETANNPAYKFEYDASDNIGSISMFIGAGSYVSVLIWSGTTLTNVGSYV